MKEKITLSFSELEKPIFIYANEELGWRGLCSGRVNWFCDESDAIKANVFISSGIKNKEVVYDTKKLTDIILSYLVNEHLIPLAFNINFQLETNRLFIGSGKVTVSWNRGEIETINGYCSHCENYVKPEDKFCGNCGARILGRKRLVAKTRNNKV